MNTTTKQEAEDVLLNNQSANDDTSPATFTRYIHTNENEPSTNNLITNVLITRLWLALGILALAVAGLYSLLLAGARSPYVQDLFHWQDLFKTTLVEHVNLSVLVWSLAFCNVMWTSSRLYHARMIDCLPWLIACTGTISLAIAPFLTASTPLLNNYIPMMLNPVFQLGILMFGIGIALSLVRPLIQFTYHLRTSEGCALLSCVIITLCAGICLFISYYLLAPDIADYHPEDFYERAFWAGGHILQFTYTQMMLVAWLWLASAIGISLPRPSVIVACFIIPLLITLPSPLIYFFYAVDSAEHIKFFTNQMRYGGGLSAAVIGMFLLHQLIKQRKSLLKSSTKNALFASILLFGTGGFLAFMIRDINVIIPAHYHGSIVGITLAFMGLTFLLLPRLGFQPVEGRIARLQPLLYGGGQLLHILGLAWSGGYGVLRKTPGMMETAKAKISMGLMGAGALIAVIGGLIFVFLVLRTMIKGGKTDRNHRHKSRKTR